MSDSLDADLLNIFRDEVGEYLETLNNALMQIETADALDVAAVRELNRVAHSMKGASRAVGLKVVETIAHYMEEVFEAALQHNLDLTPAVCDLLYDGLDLIQNIMDGGETDQETLAAVLVQLEQIVVQGATLADDTAVHDDAADLSVNSDGTSPSNSNGALSESTPPPAEMPIAQDQARDTNTVVMRPAEESIRVPVNKLDRLMAEVSELLVARMQADERMREVQSLRRLHGKWRREWQGIRAAYIRLARRLQDDEDDANADVAIIFRFLESNQRNLLASNQQLTHLVQSFGQDNLRLTTLSDELQDDVSGMRMVSFETLIGGFQRMARDLARDTGKQVYLDVDGMTVEVDKTVLDALKDPIMHLLRNAVDHGIELPEKRTAIGKPAMGRVTLAVEQRGNEIVVRVSDDGGGLDPVSIQQKALSLGLISAQDTEVMNDDDLRSLIFHPGMTTNTEVTPISGRGIGMDVVRDRVESLRGQVSVNSVPGEGTTISLNVPVSLTRIRCVLLEIGDETYAIPSAVVERMVTLSRDSVFTAENRDMVVLGERPVPLVSMSAVLGIPGAARMNSDDEITLLVLQAADRTVAFEVDGLQSERELVLKPLGREIARAPFVSGAALLGSGAAIIVLGANDLVRSATGRALPAARRLPTSNGKLAAIERRLSVLVIDDSITTRTLEKNILETAGFQVSVAIDGEEAWHIINEQYFDVIISDVEMPKMNGLELVQRIKGNDRTRHIPVILLTSLGKPEHQEAGLRAGADAYLVKSQFDQGELLQMIRAVI